MALLELVLQGINDREPVTERMERSQALRELVEGYQHYTRDDATLPTITSVTSGAELKNAVRHLKPEAQLILLKKYSDTINGVAPVESAEKIEERREHQWFVKLISVVASSILLIMVVALVSALLRSKEGPDANVVTEFITTTLEIIELIFEGSK